MATIEDQSGNLVNTKWTQEHKDVLYMVCKKTGFTEVQAYQFLIKYNGNYKNLIAAVQRGKLVEMVTRQTTYTEKEAFEELKKYNGDVQIVLREYLNTGSKLKEVESRKTTTNQKIFSEIRGFMDTALQGYNKRKEHAEHLKKAQELCDNANKSKNDD